MTLAALEESSDYWADVVGRYGSRLSEPIARKIARAHSTTIEALTDAGELPKPRGGFVTALRLAAALGY